MTFAQQINYAYRHPCIFTETSGIHCLGVFNIQRKMCTQRHGCLRHTHGQQLHTHTIMQTIMSVT